MDAYKLTLEQIKYQGTKQLLSASHSQKCTARVSAIQKTNALYRAGFASVTILEEDVNAYYGNVKITGSNVKKHISGCQSKPKYQEIDKELVDAVKLPESYKGLKDGVVYYHGEAISQYKLVQTAVAGGKMELTEDVSAYMAAKTAFQVMIEESAKTKYGWSNTKYSEDGHYTFTKNEDGTYSWHLVEDAAIGASLDDIANWICSGTPNRNIERRFLTVLQSADPDLYEAAQNIGKEVRTYHLMTAAYESGALSDAQHDYDLSLLGILFGERHLEAMYQRLARCKQTGNYTSLLELYQPKGAAYLAQIRQRQLEKTGGTL